MELKISEPITSIEEVSVMELNKYFINNIVKVKYDSLRSKSKAPTFALTYQGTAITLEKNCGFSPEVAQQVYDNYHTLYATSTEWVKDKIAKAADKGYATTAFGLRIRCPLLHKSILGKGTISREAEAEGRTLGNAISGQSYGLLNGRASVEFMRKVRKSKYRLKIRQCAHIHDAQYFRIADELEVVQWVNQNLAESMSWQELPELKHERITLPAELDIFYPSWAESTTLPNNLNQQEIYDFVRGKSND